MQYRPSPLEGFIFQLALWLGVWMLNEYTATLLTIIIPAIVFSVLLLAKIAEWIEPSRVPRRFFTWMAVGGGAPLVAAGLYFLLLRAG